MSTSVTPISLYSTHVADYENAISFIYDKTAPLHLRRETLSTIGSMYDSLVHEFLSIYPDRSLDIDDYYQVDCMARPPNKPPQFVIINEEGVIVYEEGFVPVPIKLMPTDSLSNYGGPAWYMRKHFHPDATVQSHQAVLDKPVDPAFAPYPSQEEVVSHQKRDRMQIEAYMKEQSDQGTDHIFNQYVLDTLYTLDTLTEDIVDEDKQKKDTQELCKGVSGTAPKKFTFTKGTSM
jgi:hypothetical protein